MNVLHFQTRLVQKLHNPNIIPECFKVCQALQQIRASASETNSTLVLQYSYDHDAECNRPVFKTLPFLYKYRIKRQSKYWHTNHNILNTELRQVTSSLCNYKRSTIVLLVCGWWLMVNQSSRSRSRSQLTFDGFKNCSVAQDEL